ncbi:MAG TPA: DoxX family protein [Byssovorax sp.]|jgi:putative oxidoreductase
MIDLAALRARALTALEPLKPAALLLARLGVGLLFLSTGWGKVHSLEKVTQFFTSLGIPAPGLNAVVVGYSELLCGAALCIGVLTRLATVPLIVSMIVAILTAKLKDLHDPFDLVGFDEFTYVCVLVVLAVFGPGSWSVDHLIAKKLDTKKGA